jgi:hypothetical protein
MSAALRHHKQQLHYTSNYSNANNPRRRQCTGGIVGDMKHAKTSDDNDSDEGSSHCSLSDDQISHNNELLSELNTIPTNVSMQHLPQYSIGTQVKKVRYDRRKIVLLIRFHTFTLL